MKKSERKEIKKMLRKQLELLTKQSEQVCFEEAIAASHAIIELSKLIIHL